MFQCFSWFAPFLKVGLIITSGLLIWDIAMNCAIYLIFLPLSYMGVFVISGCIVKIGSLIWFIHLRKNGIPVEGQVYNRNRLKLGLDFDGGPVYKYHLWVVYDVSKLNIHTKCGAATSATYYESLKKTSSSNEVDEEIFTETEQKKVSFNVSHATYEAVNRSGNDSIEVLVLPGRAGNGSEVFPNAVLSQTLSSDLQEISAKVGISFWVTLVPAGLVGIVLPFFLLFADGGDCPGHYKFSYALITILGVFLFVVLLVQREVEQESPNDGSAGSNGSVATDHHKLVTLSTDDTTVMTEMMSIHTDDGDSISGAKATTSIQLDNNIGLHDL